MYVPEIIFDQRVPEEHEGAVREYIASFATDGPCAILSLEHFAVLTGLNAETVFGITNSPHAFYRTFSLQKASGGRRTISAPLPVALRAQRWILSNILEKKSCHPAAKAYVKGQSIRSNARFHRAQNFVLKLDVSDFFGSIKEAHIYEIFRAFGYTKAVSVGLSKICCLNGSLPQGAATSGYLSNILLIDFDDEALKFCQERNLRYTRYADDITVSGAALDADEIISKVASLFEPLSLKLNRKKTNFIAQSGRQKVTGVVVNEKLSVEKEYRRELRQAHYYIMKYGIFGHARYVQEKDPKGFLEKMIGQVSYALFIRQSDKSLLAMRDDLLSERLSAFGY